MEIVVQPDESLEKALKRFRRVCQKGGLMSELRRRATYTKPSEERRLAIAKARRKQAKKVKRTRY